MIKLYLDEDVPEAIAHALRLRGHDTLTVKETGNNHKQRYLAQRLDEIGVFGQIRCFHKFLPFIVQVKEQRYDEALPYVREAANIFRETGSRHLPETEATLEELQGLGDKQGYIRPCLY